MPEICGKLSPAKSGFPDDLRIHFPILIFSTECLILYETLIPYTLLGFERQKLCLINIARRMLV